MKKYILAAISGLLVTFPMTGFAVSVNLNLFDRDLSILDSLLLIAIGLTVIGVLLICIAMLKSVKTVEEVEEGEEYPVFEPAPAEPEEEILEPEPVAEEAEELVVEEILEEETESEYKPESEPEPEPEIVYPKLTLTGVNNTDFKVAPLKEETTIGRRKTNDVIFSDISISGEHCAISVEEDKVYIEDRNSTNGTYLNGKRITGKTEIHKGDIIGLGQLEYRVGL